MEPKERESIANKIEEKLADTEKKIREYRELTKPVSPENAIGRISRMEAINNKAVFEAALHEAEEKFKKLQEAKERIHSSDFGKCVKCHAEIPFGRLMIMPESTHCVRCARLS